MIPDPKDALGNPIVLGAKYGTVSKYDGTNTVVVGIAEKITEAGNVTLHITKRLAEGRGGMVDRTSSTYWGDKPKRTVSHKPYFLFPVEEQVITFNSILLPRVMI
jgi:hypothetical protein